MLEQSQKTIIIHLSWKRGQDCALCKTSPVFSPKKCNCAKVLFNPAENDESVCVTEKKGNIIKLEKYEKVRK